MGGPEQQPRRRPGGGLLMRALGGLLLGILAVALTLPAGCRSAPESHRRGKIHGKVTLDGKPVAKANIRFIALEASGINVLAAVKDGVYDVPASQGPVKGKYRVEFSVPKPGRRVPNPDIPGAWLEEPIETLPARYHRDSKYVLDYDPDDPKSFDAELTSKKQAARRRPQAGDPSVSTVPVLASNAVKPVGRWNRHAWQVKAGLN